MALTKVSSESGDLEQTFLGFSYVEEEVGDVKEAREQIFLEMAEVVRANLKMIDDHDAYQRGLEKHTNALLEHFWSKQTYLGKLITSYPTCKNDAERVGVILKLSPLMLIFSQKLYLQGMQNRESHAELSGELSKATKQIGKLTLAVTESEELIQRLGQDYDKLQAEYEFYKSEKNIESSEYQVTIDRLNYRCQEINKERDEMNHEMANMRTRLENLKEELAYKKPKTPERSEPRQEQEQLNNMYMFAEEFKGSLREIMGDVKDFVKSLADSKKHQEERRMPDVSEQFGHEGVNDYSGGEYSDGTEHRELPFAPKVVANKGASSHNMDADHINRHSTPKMETDFKMENHHVTSPKRRRGQRRRSHDEEAMSSDSVLSDAEGRYRKSRHAPRSSPSSLKIISGLRESINPFTARNSLTIVNHMNQIEDYLNLLNVPDKSKSIYLPWTFDQQYRSFFDSIFKRFGHSWTQIKNKCLFYFGPYATPNEAKMAAIGMKCRLGQNPTEFLGNLKCAYELAGRDASDQSPELRELFFHALPTTIKMTLSSAFRKGQALSWLAEEANSLFSLDKNPYAGPNKEVRSNQKVVAETRIDPKPSGMEGTFRSYAQVVQAPPPPRPQRAPFFPQGRDQRPASPPFQKAYPPRQAYTQDRPAPPHFYPRDNVNRPPYPRDTRPWENQEKFSRNRPQWYSNRNAHSEYERDANRNQPRPQPATKYEDLSAQVHKMEDTLKSFMEQMKSSVAGRSVSPQEPKVPFLGAIPKSREAPTKA